MKKNCKDAIVEAAIMLFNTKGYNGISIRDIARKAEVNPANIAYYFHNKHGLLEYCFMNFFENYMAEIEKGFAQIELGAAHCLKEIGKNLLAYQCENIHLTRFILREMSIDSQVVREIMSTYYVKERFYFKTVLEKGIEAGEFSIQSIPYTIIQFKGLLMMPFLNIQYATEVLHVFPHEQYFLKMYEQELVLWIERMLCTSERERVLAIQGAG
ncbi:TetR family transcriptional regulator [Bacillus canaveralius]|uniref:TetR family transcriptional regulator n=1 Tax=Bacillus canaveralius TaxID=1403243 RepID=A0A2N5GN88_9BACI|nr:MULTISPECIES: forespore capture DNA-binding protein RefZ [Bacillus]PLR83709.1 TetR family transcriptional regulator [Bacillus canaveralius]PLR83803.1 TetR family transcriptional regulator [Bacillus sp. V33-4]PLR95189.1 TetR family transcriptional regulator [Bacillus canaveralius]